MFAFLLYHQYVIGDSRLLFKLDSIIPLTTWTVCLDIPMHDFRRKGTDRWARHRSPPLQKESTAGGIDQLPCSCICSSLVSLYYKLVIQKVPPRALVPRIRSSRCIYWWAITIRSNLVSESLTIPFISIEIFTEKYFREISCMCIFKMWRNFVKLDKSYSFKKVYFLY